LNIFPKALDTFLKTKVKKASAIILPAASTKVQVCRKVMVGTTEGTQICEFGENSGTIGIGAPRGTQICAS